MNRAVILTVALSALALSACDSGTPTEPSPETTAASDGNDAGTPAADVPLGRLVREADCLGELVPLLGLGADLSVTTSGDTGAGCEFAGVASRNAEDLATSLTDTLSSQGYSLRDSVGAKGGVRLSFDSTEGLALSALVRAGAAAEDSESTARLDLHWYDPARLDK